MPPPALLHAFARPAEEAFLPIVRGEGAHVWDDRGRQYVDAFASLWYCQVGHGREEIADAVATQLRTLGGFHTFERFTNEPAEELSATVAALSHLPDPRVFLTNSGSEAVDTAIKLARLHWAWQGQPERTLVVSRRRAYHGVTYGATSAQGLAVNKQGWGPLLDDVVQVDADDLDELTALFERDGHRIAALVTEPVQGGGGVHPPAPGYLQAVRDLCDRHGALLVSDEVICGFGRLGTWTGAERFGITPDLVTFAKGVTSGYLPLGGVVLARRVVDVFEADPSRWLRHGFTYSGHPATSAAALANIAILRDEGLLARADHIAARLGSGLGALADHPLVREVRGVGGMWGVELGEPVAAAEVRDAMLPRGVIARAIADNTLAFCPPLVIADAELDHVLAATSEALAEVAAAVEEPTP